MPTPAAAPPNNNLVPVNSGCDFKELSNKLTPLDAISLFSSIFLMRFIVLLFFL